MITFAVNMYTYLNIVKGGVCDDGTHKESYVVCGLTSIWNFMA
jgi:hypothetical protein